MRSLLLIALAILTSCSFQRVNDSVASERDVREADRARFAAVVSRNVNALEALLASDLTYCHSGGLCEDKAHYIEAISKAELRYESFAPEELTVKLVGDVAILNGRAKARVARGADPLRDMKLGFTEVFLHREGRWQLLTWRSVALNP